MRGPPWPPPPRARRAPAVDSEARTLDARVARAAQLVADEREADQRRNNPAFRRRKDALCSAAQRQRDRLGGTPEYTPVPGAVIVQEPVRKRVRRA